MDFWTLNALRDLDERTPVYLRHEIFAHGDLTTVRRARDILHAGIDPSRLSWRVLREVLRLVPESDANAG